MAYRLHFQARYSGLADLTVSLWQGLDGTGEVLQSDENGDIWLLLDSELVSFSYAYTREADALENGETQVEVVTRLNERLSAVTIYETGTNQLTGQRPTGPYALGGKIYGVADPYPLVTFRTDCSHDILISTSVAGIYTINFAFEYPAPPRYFFVTEDNNQIQGDAPLDGLHYNLLYAPVTPVSLTLDRRFDQPLSLEPHNIDPRMTQSHHRVLLQLPGELGLLEFLNGYSTLEETVLFTPELDGPLTGGSLWLQAEYWNAAGTLGQLLRQRWDGESNQVTASFPDIQEIDEYTPLDGETLPGTRLNWTANIGDEVSVWYEDRFSVSQIRPWWIRRWTVHQNDVTQPVIFPLLPPGASDWTLIHDIPNAQRVSSTAEGQVSHADLDDGSVQSGTVQTLLTTPVEREAQHKLSPNMVLSNRAPLRRKEP